MQLTSPLWGSPMEAVGYSASVGWIVRQNTEYSGKHLSRNLGCRPIV